MYIVDVIAAVKIPKLETSVLSYFSPRELQQGALVRVPLGRQKINGIVVRSRDAGAHKMQLKRSEFQLKSVTAVLSEEPVLSPLQFKLLSWAAEYYLFPFPVFVKTMLPPYLAKLAKAAKLGPPGARAAAETMPAPKPVLLQAKNRIGEYQRAIDSCLAKGRQAFVLAPEAAQARALADAFTGPSAPLLLSSDLTPKQFFTAWSRIRSGDARLVIGTRGAVFAHFADLGLIIIDEEHNPHFKSWDMAPYYHAGTVALRLAELSGAQIIMGSSSPSVAARQRAQEGIYELKELPEPRTAPSIRLVDMRNELRDKNYSPFSYQLKNLLEEIISSSFRRAILFVSRRGSEPFSFCRDCNFIEACPHCATYLTRHTSPADRLICHSCGFTKAHAAACARCGGPRVKAFGEGTETVKEELKKLFGYKEALIMDADTAKTAREQEKIIEAFTSRKSRVLIGTQTMLNKRHISPVDLIAIISLDNLLYLPDYTIGERMFHIVESLFAYADPHTVFFFQTRAPEYELVEETVAHDYARLFAREQAARKELNYPPFTNIVKLVFRGATEKEAEKKAETARERMAGAIERRTLPIELVGPAPAYTAKVKNQHFAHLILKIGPVSLKDRNEVLALAQGVTTIDVDPVSLL